MTLHKTSKSKRPEGYNSSTPVMNKHTNFNIQNIDTAVITHIDSVRRIAVIKDPKSGQSNQVQISESISDIGLPPSNKGIEAIISKRNGELIVTGFISSGGFFMGDKSQVGKSDESGGSERNLFESLFSQPFEYTAYKEKDRNLNYRRRKPYDIIPGDIGWRNDAYGNSISALRGINQIKANDLTQIIQIALENLTRITTNNFEIFWGGGILQFSNYDNKPNIKFKMADDHLNKFKKNIYDFEMELGNPEDGNFLSAKFITKDKKVLSFGFDKKGNIFVEHPKDKMTRIRDNNVFAVGGNSVKTVGKKYIVDVGEDSNEIIGLNKNVDINGSLNIDLKTLLSKANIGDKNLTDENLVVLQKHLDDFDLVVKLLLMVLSSPSSGDLGIPVPLIARLSAGMTTAGLANQLTDLIAKFTELQLLSSTNAIKSRKTQKVRLK